MTTWSLRHRLTLAVVALVAAVVFGFALVVFEVVERAAARQFDGGLRQRAHAWSALVEHDLGGYEMELPPAADDARAIYVETWCPDDTVLARSRSLGVADLPRPPAGHIAGLTLPDGRAGRAHAYRFVPRREDGSVAAPCTLVLAEGTEDVTAALATARRWFVATSLLALIVATVVTAWLIGRGVRPLDRLGQQLEAIDGDTLATRVELPSPPRELAAPVAKLNQLLVRLDAAFARERQFTADVSHELRTPLAGLRALLEVAEFTATTADAYRDATTRALAIVGELTRLIESLLALARADSGQLVTAPVPVALRTLVESSWRGHAATATARGLELRNRLAAETTVITDPALATIVIGNLLANAAAYTAPGGWIELSATDGAVLEVLDSGPPIPAADLPRVFDRLWRGDPTRTGPGGHAGLGLALARSLSVYLGWSITATNRDDGAVSFRIVPAAAAGGRGA